MARSSLAPERMAVSFPIVAAVLVFLAFIIPKSISASKQNSEQNS
jgi:hypothetical protein